MRLVLQVLQKQPAAQLFVNPVSSSIRDYRKIISKPMSLVELGDNLHSGKYSTIEKFLADYKLIVQNAHDYNGMLSDVGR